MRNAFNLTLRVPSHPQNRLEETLEDVPDSIDLESAIHGLHRAAENYAGRYESKNIFEFKLEVNRISLPRKNFVGETSDWSTMLAHSPDILLNKRLADWNPFHSALSANFKTLPKASPVALIYILIGHLDALH